MVDQERGVLYPAQMPQLHRIPAPEAASELISWLWIPEWDLPEGVTSRQEVVAFPALNLVVMAEGIVLAGATTKRSHRDLHGSGWAVGALLTPAAAAALSDAPAELVDREVAVDAEGLRAEVAAAMSVGGAEGRTRAAQEVSAWLVSRVGEVSEAARQANRMAALLMTDATVRRADDAAARLAVSLRTLQRMAHRYVGVPPLAMIRRRRLQEGAQRLRDDPGADLAGLAAELGYADHAHLSHDFRAVLGLTPSDYRGRVSD
ncbi:helix-turn-helix domain-containing protein [Microbacterium keratanolyticum]|uniref:helix-turn-helix domain-containing protein n=1 Tax=Microbacterium keratanolyticum TaxID=67574 RepID=UPI003641E3BB